ncbi:hypothetical protein [Candidatus Palauibacter sp.]|uniref:hypothetical protein n=1 Tax=Candidatus Palauibacter sp. TaxID=3101350 RepID=UPI003C6F61CE
MSSKRVPGNRLAMSHHAHLPAHRHPRDKPRERHDCTELEIAEGWPLEPGEVAPPAGSGYSAGGEDEQGLVKPEALVVLSQPPIETVCKDLRGTHG